MFANNCATRHSGSSIERSTVRYGERGIMYTPIEVGHSAQNVYLQVEALGLGTCAIGAFHEDAVRALLNLPAEETPLYLLPVGVLA
jgi:SagB-type dehydrogenase family enzyme